MLLFRESKKPNQELATSSQTNEKKNTGESRTRCKEKYTTSRASNRQQGPKLRAKKQEQENEQEQEEEHQEGATNSKMQKQEPRNKNRSKKNKNRKSKA